MDEKFDKALAEEHFTWQDVVIFLMDGHLEKEIQLMMDQGAIRGLEDGDQVEFKRYMTEKIMKAIGR